MRLFSDIYCCANPFLEPISLDTPATSGSDEEAESVGNLLHDPDENPERDMADAQMQAAVLNFVAALGAKDRVLIERLFWDGYSQADVARSLRVSRAAVSKRMHRIVEKGRLALASLRPETAVT